MNECIKATSDIFIKYLFGSEENKDLLIDFLNANMVEIGLEKIVDVEIKNPFNIKTFRVDKESILDVKAKDLNGRLYNIEMQLNNNPSFTERSLYYWAKLYSSQLSEKEIYSELKPTICINILDFELFKETADFFNCFLIKEKEKNLILTDNLVIIFAELPKLNKLGKHEDLCEWLYYLKNEGGDDKMLETLLEKNNKISKAHNQFKKFNSDDELREIYESKKKYEMDKNTMLYYARKEGLEKGIEEGKLKGKLEGKLEGKLDIASKMLKNGFSKSDVMKFTALTSEEIDNI